MDSESPAPSRCDACVYNRSHSKGQIPDGRCLAVFRTKKLFGLQCLSLRDAGTSRPDCGFDEKKKKDIWRVIEAAWDIPHDCDCMAGSKTTSPT